MHLRRTSLGLATAALTGVVFGQSSSAVQCQGQGQSSDVRPGQKFDCQSSMADLTNKMFELSRRVERHNQGAVQHAQDHEKTRIFCDAANRAMSKPDLEKCLLQLDSLEARANSSNARKAVLEADTSRLKQTIVLHNGQCPAAQLRLTH
jgi:hypothetical protein